MQFFKIIATVQAIVLSGAVVHIFHLQKRGENITSPPPSNQSVIPVQSTVRQFHGSDFELLPDIQELRDTVENEILEQNVDGPQGELFPENNVAKK